MLHRFGELMERGARRIVPDPFVFALLLTIVAFGLGWGLTDSGPLTMVDHWVHGFWELLAFAMQMCLILVTGHAIATAPLVRRGLRALARLPRTTGSAVVLVAAATVVASLVHWGLGIVTGAILAREVAENGERHGRAFPYALLGAAGYAGFVAWHGGLSGSAPLKVAEANHFLAEVMGTVPITETLFSPLNLVVAAGLLVVVPGTLFLLRPRAGDAVRTLSDLGLERAADATRAAPSPTDVQRTPAERIQESPVLVVLTVLAGGVWLVRHFVLHGFALDLNVVNFLFLMTGLALQGSPARYVRAVSDGARACSGIILQFPFYAGIMGMMKYSGLVTLFATWAADVSSATTLPLLTLLSGGLVNLFVPSGGGQWAVQGPVVIEAAQRLGVAPAKVVMALAYGDQWTNLLQPFWALPLLGITGLKAGQIIGYTAVVLLSTGLLFATALFLF